MMTLGAVGGTGGGATPEAREQPSRPGSDTYVGQKQRHSRWYVGHDSPRDGSAVAALSMHQAASASLVALLCADACFHCRLITPTASRRCRGDCEARWWRGRSEPMNEYQSSIAPGSGRFKCVSSENPAESCPHALQAWRARMHACVLA